MTPTIGLWRELKDEADVPASCKNGFMRLSTLRLRSNFFIFEFLTYVFPRNIGVPIDSPLRSCSTLVALLFSTSFTGTAMLMMFCVFGRASLMPSMTSSNYWTFNTRPLNSLSRWEEPPSTPWTYNVSISSGRHTFDIYQKTNNVTTSIHNSSFRPPSLLRPLLPVSSSIN